MYLLIRLNRIRCVLVQLKISFKKIRHPIIDARKRVQTNRRLLLFFLFFIIFDYDHLLQFTIVVDR